MSTNSPNEDEWARFLNEGEATVRHVYHLLGLLPSNPRLAIEAAQRLLHVTGHSDPSGPWLPVGGVGVHTGPAFVGVVGGTDGNPTDFTALGDNMNITARLVSTAGPGEVLISDAAYAASGLELGDLEHQQLELKGMRGPTGVRVLRISPG